MGATTGPVDWDTARRVAARAARPGPAAPRAELEALVAHALAAPLAGEPAQSTSGGPTSAAADQPSR